MELINLTPHDLVVYTTPGSSVKIPASGAVARVTTELSPLPPIKYLDGTTVPVNRTKFGEVDGLPPETNQKGYVVSRIVFEAVKHRRLDVFAPGEPVRDPQGRVIGCRGLSR